MNPFLEDFWPDVHTSLVVYLRNALQPQLPEGLFARVEESLTVDAEGEPSLRAMRADVLVAHVWGEERASEAGAGVTLAEPDLYRVLESEPERRIEIIDVRSGGGVVTVIEILSPSNKASGRDAYRTKSRLCRAAGVNLVEIDLLRGGEHAVAVPLGEIPKHKRKPYLICVSRNQDRSLFHVWHVGLGERLPAFLVPLRPGDHDAMVDLQPLVDAAYRDGGYGRLIDYRKPLQPPLAPEALAKIEDLLRAQER